MSRRSEDVRGFASPGDATRRDFLKSAAVGSAAVLAAGHVVPGAASAQGDASAQPAAQSPATLPTVQLGKHTITRLITGYNPIGGYSHLSATMSRIMSDYFTVDRTVEFLKHCEALGINTFQFDVTEKTMQVFDRLWNEGSKLNFICLWPDGDTSLEVVMKYKPIAIAHHGGRTDSRFRAGEAGQVRDFVKQVHDLGALAGVSAHNPENIARIADEGWENDFFMTCFHNLTRTRESMMEKWNTTIVGEPYTESDRDEMTKIIRQIDKPCLGFKILAAGRRCDSASTVEAAFRYAFENIKPIDAVIVGMFPYFQDEVSANVAYAAKYGVPGAAASAGEAKGKA